MLNYLAAKSRERYLKKGQETSTCVRSVAGSDGNVAIKIRN